MNFVSRFWTESVAYQFRHDFGKVFRLLAGVNNEHRNMFDNVLGTHSGDQGGGFVGGQVNYKFLTLNAGVREEYLRQDSSFRFTLPVFRAGANFEIRKYNYIRMAFGQAQRFPSIAEQYINYSLAGVNIIPNLTLQSERGYTMEIGYKRSLKIGNWLGYLDADVFYTQFKNMIEFVFGVNYVDSTNTLTPFFQSENVGRVRIFGWELSMYGEGRITPDVDVVTQLGYTYFYGGYMDSLGDPGNYNPRIANLGQFLHDAFTHYTLKTALNDQTWLNETAGMLRYRNPHQFKADFDFILFRKYHVGTALQYYSYMTQVDAVFQTIIPGVDEYRQQHRNKGDAIWDLRAGYEVNHNISLNFLVKNVLNTYTVVRIARPDPPRTFAVQMVVNLGGLKRNKLSASQQMGNM